MSLKMSSIAKERALSPGALLLAAASYLQGPPRMASEWPCSSRTGFGPPRSEVSRAESSAPAPPAATIDAAGAPHRALHATRARGSDAPWQPEDSWCRHQERSPP